MFKKYRSILAILFAGLLIGVTSCGEGFLERYPRESIASEEALTTIEGVEGALAGLYNRFQAGEYNHREMNLAGELLSDQMDIAQTNAGRMTNHPTNEEGAGFGIWTRVYNDINRANSILYYIDDIEDADETLVNEFKGQAHALRAWMYFDLLRIYARPYMHQEPFVQGEPLGVIYKTKPFAGIDETTFEARGTIEEGYQLVLDDLYAALGYLSDDEYPYQFTEAAVLGTLARVYLYMGKWSEAANYAEAAIDHPSTELIHADNFDDYMTLFADAPGAESILELGYTEADRPGMNTSVAGMAIYCEETGEGYGDVILRQDLIQLLDSYGAEGHPAGDMYYEAVKGGQLCAFQKKYHSHRGYAYWDDIKMMRTSEMYFIAAEAHAEMGDLNQAEEFLMTLREHRGMEHVDINVDSAEEFIDVLFTDKRVEYFSEMSHRWFDLRRRGMDITKGVPDEDAGTPVDFDDYRVVERIPTAEISANENCVQNPGY